MEFRCGPILSLRTLAVAVALTTSGTGCLKPCVLPRNAQMPEILTVLNRNSDLVESLISSEVKIRGRSQGQFFMVNASLALQKSRRFRLVARSILGTEEVDLGSNDEEFWFWVARAEPPTLYYCQHAEHAQTVAEHTLPLDPNWIMEALGINALDPADIHEEPVIVSGRRMKLTTRRFSPRGEQYQKVTFIDACRGWVVEQQMLDPDGKLLARAVLSEHRKDPTVGAYLPHRIELTWPNIELALTLSLDNLRVNQLPGDADDPRWSRPSKEREVNLCGRSGSSLPDEVGGG